MNEAEIRETLVKELFELGYPETSIRYEFTVSLGRSQRRHIDVAIIDPDTNDVIAIIEVKRKYKSDALELAAKQVAAYSKMLPSAPLAFIYVANGNEKHIGLVSEETGKLELIPSLPNFSALRVGDRAQQKVETKKKSNRITDSFTVICYVLAILVAIILFLDIFSIFKFSSQQLTLLGIVIGLLIIPYAAKFKLLGMEFERHSRPSNKGT
ncbi:type I restriction enzyme HsdR N-terminal domain-containing protein [Vibrio vulnificus]|uniref:type I restriction enzyme HsdR N-terminal domain-containing protein n=1 Tax=Vibrio sp. TRT 29B02 TaxID=3418508 RepID=UPI00292C0ED8|nr:type I restriction enzyme HsdR N-terminal domain-containing protein [Vibrio vulnificus]